MLEIKKAQDWRAKQRSFLCKQILGWIPAEVSLKGFCEIRRQLQRLDG